MPILAHVWKSILKYRWPIADKLRKLRQYENLSLGELERLQRNRLKSILEHAYENVPYYRETFNERPSPADMEALPLLRKETLREEFDDLQSEDIGSRDSYVNTTGGSTGRPVKFVQDAEYQGWNGAVKRVFDSWGGRGISDPKVRVWGSEEDIVDGTDLKTRVGRWLRNEHIVNAFDLSEETLAAAVETINSSRPHLVHGYVESVEQIARYVQERDLEIHSPTSVHTTAGTLYPEMRECIEAVFGCRVQNRYGSREFGDIACECPERTGLHVSAPTHYVEIVDLDTGERLEPGETGEIAITSLTNYSMPLIRYPVGDVGRLADGECACGCHWPRLEHVEGRVSDIFTAPDGTTVHGEYFTHVMYGRDWIDWFQVIQHARDDVEVRIVPNGDVERADSETQLDEIREEFVTALGEGVEISFVFADEIEREESGKYRFTVSKVER